MAACDALTPAEISTLNADMRTEADRLKGGPAKIVTFSNGQQVPSPSKAIADAKLFKPSIPWTPTTLVTDATQAYSDSGNDYAPQPSLLPFTTGATFTASNWYLIQGITETELETVIDTRLTESYATMSVALADTAAVIGAKFSVDDYAAGHISGVLFFEWVAAATGTDDGGSFIDHDTLSLQAKQNFPEIITINMFGAATILSDSVTNIQAAIDYAEGSTDRKTVSANDGTYTVTQSNYVSQIGGPTGVFCIMMKSGVWFKGTSKFGTVIKLADSQGGPGTFGRIIASQDGSRLSNARISHLTVDGNKDNQVANTQYSNMLIEASDDVEVSDTHHLNCNGNGIMVRGVNDDNAVLIASNIRILRNDIDDATSIGIQSTHFTDLQIRGNRVVNTTNNCIDINGNDEHTIPSTTADSLGWIIDGNIVGNSDVAGIFPETVGSGICSNNHIAFCDEGIHVNRIDGEPVQNALKNNNILSCPIGIIVSGDTGGVDIQHNTINESTIAYVALGTPGGNISGVTISENTLRGSVDTVPWLFTNCTNVSNVIANNNYTHTVNRRTDTISGTQTNYTIDTPVPIDSDISQKDGLNLLAPSGSNTVNHKNWMFNAGNVPVDFGGIDVRSFTTTGGSEQGQMDLRTKEAGSDNVGIQIRGNMLGFYNTSAITQPAVTGSRAGNAALASLLTGLDNLGLIDDQTTA
ncbi:right-handed parallel beta-helix repeat-containing protein [Candidatus Pacearchaeota archaeon]|nr:right-handed parallel beta-helix repeat-containing protein [Candidatus Pacearchaeota archaeon]